jgi:septum formation protein
VLASASPARLQTLRSAGVHPVVAVSTVDEAAGVAGRGLAPSELAAVLARAKAEDVAGRPDLPADAVVLGCDSLLELDGAAYGKPLDAGTARRRWRLMRGHSGMLHTGHWLVDTRDGTGTGATSSTVVHFAELSDAEIDAYVATGEPLQVAGGFTLDGLGGPFVTGVDGDPHGVVGVSLPLLRLLLAELGVSWPDLWSG